MTLNDYQDLTDTVLRAALAHVPFDGWSEAALRAAIADSGVDPALARAAFPRGAVDLALAFHAQGDRMMQERVRAAELSEMKFREKIAFAVRTRLELIEDKELVRRGMTLFALPHHAPDGAKAIWQTADAIWTVLGDRSDDVNWYTKRASLGAVYSSTVLYWLGDQSEEHQASWAFLDRRIEDVMQVEAVKAKVKGNPTLMKALAGPLWALGKIRAPMRQKMQDLPGGWTAPR